MRKRKIYNIVGTITALSQACLLLILAMAAATASEKKQIKIEQFSLNRSVAYLGEEISSRITVSAPASLRKKNLRVRYYLDKKEIGKQTITGFDPAGIAKTEFSFKDSPEGRYQFRVIVDIEGKTEKSDEVSRQLAILSLPGGMTSQQFSSNTDNKTSKKDPASQKPDLEPLSIDFNIASPRLGQKIQIKSRISNTGSVQADNVKIRLFINGQPFGDDITMNIAAGSQANIETDFLPRSEGKKDILLLINPDGEIDEESNRNNLLSKTLIVRPAEKTSAHKKIVAAPGKSSTQAGKVNLVVYIETISGVHYTRNDQVHFYITNNSKSEPAKPFMMGVQLLQGSPGKIWLVRRPIKELMPGETVTLSVNWPKDQLHTNNLYVATVDIDGKNNETDVRDNHTRPFSVISTAAKKTVPTPDSSENIASKKHLDETSLDDRNLQNKVQVSNKTEKNIQELISPVAGSSFRGEQEVNISWPENVSKNGSKLINLVLTESSSDKIVTLNAKPIAAKEGQYSWQVPDDGSVFGIYTLQAISLDGKVLAATNRLEMLPNFVNFDPPEINSTKDEIKTDVEIARTSFNGPNLEILVMNNGPAEITPSGMVGYKFTTYFVRNIPIVKEEDLVICTSSLLAELPEGEGKIISLGRNPDCPLGERGSGGRFVYAVSRFTLPILVNQLVKDPKPHNNLSKFYWPD